MHLPGRAPSRPARAGTAARATPPGRPRAALPALCATQITSWGVLYYAFPVLLPRLAADTGWSPTAATAAFSGALLVSALAGIPVGRVLDRRGPRAVMTGGSVLGACSVLGIAYAPSLTAFALAWVGAGAAMSATFYPPAFAALTRWWGADRIRALTVVTLAGGLASTVFAPLTAVLVSHLSWRETYTVLALILAAVTVPAHAFALRAPWPPAPPPPAGGGPTTASGNGVARSRPFLLLAAAMTLSACTVYAVVIGLVPLLTERGIGPTAAAWALGLGGVGQTLGRLGYAPLARRTHVTTRTVALIAAGGATTAALALVPGPYPLLVALSVAAGMVRGNHTLLMATAVSDRWGTTHYGRLSGLLTAPVTLATGLAPSIGAALSGPVGGYPALFLVLAGVSGTAALLATGGTPHAPGVTPPARPWRARRAEPPPPGTGRGAAPPG